ncbi:MAG: flavohemoprotein [Hydrococcus sp. RM1_1_31]|nr:flavohemoprotein [Hydrococcus sp. RM1_1_31]
MSLNVPLLEQTFNSIEPNAYQFASSFYETLFTDCPEARSLFVNTDMEKQKDKLIMSLVYVVTNLRYPDKLTGTLKELGAKHFTYGTIREHYPIVGSSLLKTLESFLGEQWTSEVRQAWTDAYDAISNLMLEGAQEYQSSLESSLPSQPIIQASVQSETPKSGSLKQILALGLGGILAIGLLVYAYQINQKPNSSPGNPNSSSF